MNAVPTKLVSFIKTCKERRDFLTALNSRHRVLSVQMQEEGFLSTETLTEGFMQTFVPNLQKRAEPTDRQKRVALTTYLADIEIAIAHEVAKVTLASKLKE